MLADDSIYFSSNKALQSFITETIAESHIKTLLHKGHVTDLPTLREQLNNARPHFSELQIDYQLQHDINL